MQRDEAKVQLQKHNQIIKEFSKIQEKLINNNRTDDEKVVISKDVIQDVFDQLMKEGNNNKLIGDEN